jgi:sugar lactone lactonase YvrE
MLHAKLEPPIKLPIQICEKSIVITTIDFPRIEFIGVAVRPDNTIIVSGNESVYTISENSDIKIIAGNKIAGCSDGVGTMARFSTPKGVAVMADNTIIVADTRNHCIRAISVDGTVRTIAGMKAAPGFRDGPGRTALFGYPQGVAIMPDQTIIVADTVNNCIRAISTDYTVRTIAGTCCPGFQDGPGIQAKFDGPCGVAIMSDLTIIVADTANHRIRAISADHIVRTISGRARGLRDGINAIAQFRYPEGVAIMADQTIIVADSQNNCIRAISIDGNVKTIAGNMEEGKLDGYGTESRFSGPDGVAIMPDQSIIVSDNLNHSIRKLYIEGPPAKKK